MARLMNSKWQERKARSERNGCKIGCENYMNLSVGIYGKYGRYRYPQNVKYRPDISVRPIIGRALLQTLAELVQSIGARMDAVETPCGTPGRVQAPNPLSSVATAPFYFQQPSGSASSAFTGYAPGTCPATMATAVPALAPAAYSLSQLYQSSFRMRLPRLG